MARKVFFSFHYDRDIWRASIVRNHGKSKADIVNRGIGTDPCGRRPNARATQPSNA